MGGGGNGLWDCDEGLRVVLRGAVETCGVVLSSIAEEDQPPLVVEAEDSSKAALT